MTDHDHADKTWLQPSEQEQTDFVRFMDLASLILAAIIGAAFAMITLHLGA